MSNASDLNYCETTRSADDMIKRFSEDRKEVVSLLANNINDLIAILWTPLSPVFIDNGCIFNMGQAQREYSLEDRIENGKSIVNETLINYYVCSQCKNMKRLVNFSKTKVGDPFYIECGSHAGDKLVITESKINKLYIIKESPPKTVSKILSSDYINKLKQCSAGCNSNDLCDIPDYAEMDYLGLDPYTNNMLINWYLNEQLSYQAIPNIIKMHIGFVCKGKGYSLYEYPDIGRIRHMKEHSQYLNPSGNIKKDIAKGIIKQLFATLHNLQKYNFSHGGPSSRAVLFKDEPSAYLYDNVRVECPITMKLCDLHNAGVTVIGSNNEKIRLYTKSLIADAEITKKPLKPIIETLTITPYTFDSNMNDINIEDDNDITIYRLKNPDKYFQEAMVFMYIKHLGLPIYQSSFDTYGFMVSLMSDKLFYDSVMSEESMYLLWRRMWLPEEFETVQDKIRHLHKSSDPMTRVDKVIRFLSGFGLRCDMTNYGWEMIKQW
jgi:hypothetical protein